MAKYRMTLVIDVNEEEASSETLADMERDAVDVVLNNAAAVSVESVTTRVPLNFTIKASR